MEEKVIDINITDALIMLQELKKKKHYWGDNLLKLYRGHKNYLKQFVKTGDYDLEWYTEHKIKSKLCVLLEGNKAHFKILQPKTSTIKFDCLSGNYPKTSIWTFFKLLFNKNKIWDWLYDHDLDYTFVFVLGCVVTAGIFTVVYFWYNYIVQLL